MAALGTRTPSSRPRAISSRCSRRSRPIPVYEFHPLRRCMRGDDRVRRFYEQFCTRFLSLRSDFR
jgi:hypothetical protein